MSKQTNSRKGGKNRKPTMHDRSSAVLGYRKHYRDAKIREKNALKKLRKHLSKHPTDVEAKHKIARLKKELMFV